MADRSSIQFEDGDIFYASQANEIAYPRATGLPLLGHGEKILDENLSDQSDQIKALFYAWFNRFRVFVLSGLTISITTGVLNSGGTRISIPPQNFNVPNNSTVFVWIGKTAVDSTVLVRSSAFLPDNCIPLARVVSLNGVITQLDDLRRPSAEYLPPEIPQAVPVGSVIFSFHPPTVTEIAGYIELTNTLKLISRTIYSKLFTEYGVYYSAGDGVSTFGLPGLEDCLLRFGLASSVGQKSGSDTLNVQTSNLPSHYHVIPPTEHTHGNNNPLHVHGIAQTPHTHLGGQNPHSHRAFAQAFDGGSGRTTTDGFVSKNGVGIAGEDVGSPQYLTTNLSGNNIIDLAQPTVNISENYVDVSVNAATPNITILPSSTNISATQNTGSGEPIIIAPKSIKIRAFVKY